MVASLRDRSVGAAAGPGSRAARSRRRAILRLVRLAEQCEDGWRQWFASTGIQPCEVTYEDLAQDRLTVANRVLGFLHLPRLEPGDLPPVRYRQQADSLTDRYVDLVRAAIEDASRRCLDGSRGA